MAPLAIASFSAWASWRPATCLPDDCFCEGLRDSLIRQPANTWSSLAFVVVALWVSARLSRRTRSERVVLAGAETGLFLGALVLVGLGSAFYHASLTFIGQVFDVSGMYLVATFMLLHRLGPRWSLPPLASVVGFVLVNGVLMAAQVTTPSLRRIVFGVLLVAALALEWRSTRAGRRWLATGAGLMALAFAIWFIDRRRLVCDPGSLLQGHAAWHLLGALAAACLYRSYEAEAVLTS
jgi:hypothetical protein